MMWWTLQGESYECAVYRMTFSVILSHTELKLGLIEILAGRIGTSFVKAKTVPINRCLQLFKHWQQADRQIFSESVVK